MDGVVSSWALGEVVSKVLRTKGDGNVDNSVYVKMLLVLPELGVSIAWAG